MTEYIAIDGKGGSGKTYLSERLATRLSAHVFHLDEFGDDHHPFIGIPKLVEMLEAAQGDVIIFEGVGVLDTRFVPFNAFKILVEVPEGIKRSRAASRDMPRSDRSLEEWRKIYDIWSDAEKAYFTPAIFRNADMVVGENGEFDIDAIVTRFRSEKRNGT
jgi:uridine kinase